MEGVVGFGVNALLMRLGSFLEPQHSISIGGVSIPLCIIICCEVLLARCAFLTMLIFYNGGILSRHQE